MHDLPRGTVTLVFTNTITDEIALAGTTSGVAAWRDSVWVTVGD